MKSTTRQLLSGLLVSLFITSQGSKANATIYPLNPIPTIRPFAISLYIDAQKKINLQVAILPAKANYHYTQGFQPNGTLSGIAEACFEHN